MTYVINIVYEQSLWLRERDAKPSAVHLNLPSPTGSISPFWDLYPAEARLQRSFSSMKLTP